MRSLRLKSAWMPVVVSALMVLAARAADRIETPAGSHTGVFGGYRDGAFVFESDAGERLELARRDVRRIVLAEPVEVTLQRSNESPPGTTVLLRGFEAGGFEIERDGRGQRVPLTFVARISVPMAATEQAVGGAPGPRPAIDLTGLNEAGLTPAQREAVDDYRGVRETYDRFVAESSALVARMDAATGAARMEALNALRGRRMEEQTLEGRLRRREQAVLAALGDKVGRGGARSAASGVDEGGAVDEMVAERAVMLIDTDMFRDFPDQTDRQREAITRYDAAAEACRAAMAADDGEAVAAAIRRLEHAERDLLNAFPNVVIED